MLIIALQWGKVELRSYRNNIQGKNMNRIAEGISDNFFAWGIYRDILYNYQMISNYENIIVWSTFDMKVIQCNFLKESEPTHC